MRCLIDAVERYVPPSAVVYVDIENALYRQVAVGALFRYNRIADSPADASLVFALRGATAAPCEPGAAGVWPAGYSSATR